MKKLQKLKLNDAAILNDGEMKMVFGGSGGDNGGGSGTAVCVMKCNQDDSTTYLMLDKCPSNILEAMGICGSTFVQYNNSYAGQQSCFN